jgi:hypothetical protein
LKELEEREETESTSKPGKRTGNRRKKNHASA